MAIISQQKKRIGITPRSPCLSLSLSISLSLSLKYHFDELAILEDNKAVEILMDGPILLMGSLKQQEKQHT